MSVLFYKYRCLFCFFTLGIASCGREESIKQAEPKKALSHGEARNLVDTSSQESPPDYTADFEGFSMSASWIVKPQAGEKAAIIFKWSSEEEIKLDGVEFITFKLGCGCRGKHNNRKMDIRLDRKEIEIKDFILTKGGKWEFNLNFMVQGKEHTFKGTVECAN